ncbi:MAG: DUF427 domain-containing protein [Sneathiella sp.]
MATLTQDNISASEYDLGISAAKSRVRGYKDGVLLFDTERSLLMEETHHDPIYYIPKADVNMALLSPISYRTFCPFKGNASYWTIENREKVSENIAWEYESPIEGAEEIKDHLAFDNSALDQLIVDEENIVDTSSAVDRMRNYTLAEWLMLGSWNASNQAELTEKLVARFIETGIPIMRLNIAIRQLHPLIAGESYLWTKAEGCVKTQQLMHQNLKEAGYLKSPLKLVSEGLGGIRQKLNGSQKDFEFSIMQELKDQGATDYVALPLFFSDGNIHNLTLTSDAPEGFTTAHLGQVYEALPLISRMYEVHKLKSNTSSLLQTYLGQSAGKQVLSGLTKRGDGGTIQSAILFCDLTGSTALSERLGQQDYLDHLNHFFDVIAQSVYGHGGDILKFIGDAVLAIFPLTDDTPQAREIACSNATKAIQEIVKNVEKASSKEPISCTAGLHYGEVMYGNIGSEQRLDFTVIGSAANEVARISDLCRTSDQPVLFSKQIADLLKTDLKSLGDFELRGFVRPRELFGFA